MLLAKISPRRSRLFKKGNDGMKKYKCMICNYIYDPVKGDPEHGIVPGTAFEAIPDTWSCPECGASKNDFEPVEG
jgi:rubredoxin